MKELTEDEIKALKAANPGVELHAFDDKEIGLHVVFRGPNWNEWSTYKVDVVPVETKPKVVRNFVTKLLVYPPIAEWDAFLERSPASCEMIIGEIGEVAGLRSSGVRKKL